LCRLRDDLCRPCFPGPGSYYDIDAAYAMPLSEAVETLGDVRPFQESGSSTATLERYFMERAIHESRQSVGEKDDPLVGAVVVRAGKELATAHRGELKKGEHAEYTALERKLGGRHSPVQPCILPGPCTTRGPNKTPCAKRIIERKFARVLIGMLDLTPRSAAMESVSFEIMVLRLTFPRRPHRSA